MHTSTRYTEGNEQESACWFTILKYCCAFWTLNTVHAHIYNDAISHNHVLHLGAVSLVAIVRHTWNILPLNMFCANEAVI